MFEVDKLLKERDVQYGQAWKWTGLMMHPIQAKAAELLKNAPDLYYNWIIILNKLVRLLADPYHADSWKDIAGYATLVVNHINETQGKEK